MAILITPRRRFVTLERDEAQTGATGSIPRGWLVTDGPKPVPSRHSSLTKRMTGRMRSRKRIADDVWLDLLNFRT